MKALKNPICKLLTFIVLSASSLYANSPGFYIEPPHGEVTMRYRNVNNLIVLPVVINEKLTVNLILDTGTQNIVLFGKRFEDLFQFVPNREIQFSGVGSGNPVYGKLSMGNKVAFASVIGERIPIVVVPNSNIFNTNAKIDGIIGYDIFLRFQVEIDPQQSLITFRPASSCFIPADYIRLPLRIENTKPIIDSKILLNDSTSLSSDLVIDTGSQLSLLLRTTNIAFIDSSISEVLGKGMNGKIKGIKIIAKTLSLTGINFYNQPTGIILSDYYSHGSIGMGILKEYALIINYAGAYACLRKL